MQDNRPRAQTSSPNFIRSQERVSNKISNVNQELTQSRRPLRVAEYAFVAFRTPTVKVYETAWLIQGLLTMRANKT
jgi:hypothetical protein